MNLQVIAVKEMKELEMDEFAKKKAEDKESTERVKLKRKEKA